MARICPCLIDAIETQRTGLPHKQFRCAAKSSDAPSHQRTPNRMQFGPTAKLDRGWVRGLSQPSGWRSQVAFKLRGPYGYAEQSHFAMRSATMIVGIFGVPVGTVGMIEASATVNPVIPWTDPRASVTAPFAGSAPIAHVPTG